MFYDSFKEICRIFGQSETSALVNMGMSKGSISGWKGGAEPTNRTVKQISDYFEITVDELLSGKIKEKPTTDNGNELSNNEREFLDLIRRIPPEKLSQVEDYAKFLLNNQ